MRWWWGVAETGKFSAGGRRRGRVSVRVPVESAEQAQTPGNSTIVTHGAVCLSHHNSISRMKGPDECHVSGPIDSTVSPRQLVNSQCNSLSDSASPGRLIARLGIVSTIAFAKSTTMARTPHRDNIEPITSFLRIPSLQRQKLDTPDCYYRPITWAWATQTPELRSW